jgi:hypothetical protein
MADCTMANEKVKTENSLSTEVSIDGAQTVGTLKCNVTIIMGWKSQEKKLQASSQVLTSISSVWTDMLKDVGEDETKVWRCDLAYYDGLRVIVELAHHRYEHSQGALGRETVQLIGILCRKFHLYRLLRSHPTLWTPFFDDPSVANEDAFQLQMRFYIAEALGTKAQFAGAWRNLFFRLSVGNVG